MGVPPALPGRQQKFDISLSQLPRSVDGTPSSEPPSARKEFRQRGSHVVVKPHDCKWTVYQKVR